ncbi:MULTISPECIES: D-alanyl-D-alanine carboxypeptidase family protein [Oceanobacillus]|uniref:serine-type D-Ala-D-Ala carboxypeptidase n=1 Tax=Oceanobacillus kimchii TaxID=746691 RepID=A0ABQ5TL96_9BACI|nr:MULTISPECIES: D-alanyl-D-alanine carboxypeptidase family protein [Oceanobacillus]MBT2598408.1 D-alanyl-D-alanine carboxypeptidase [Oceanobacillus sp. ISL-74]MBT2651326.1 D-alanyl-D-alanine carboxypeptidase [Oceanobacillus sp. ISL-73]MCT1575985.1 D-alanyl-D-alanine carboxypeptidase [Oceanobacillus kimchii]MCT2135622.1 D-alanyl-D-alanine carboxypeptidase [Oceanobacillus kimchii]OEH55722.1 D-alanyl-D-alanine carboxypeptidase [Oceanobacillus sp. E9]
MRKIRNVMIIGILGVLLFGHTVSAEEIGQEINLIEDATSGILIEQDTGTILYDKNAHEQLAPASMTKIMTLLLVMESLEKGDIAKEDVVIVSEKAASMGGSQIFLEAGEEMTVNDLLKGVAVASGNDASVALAEKIAGSEEAFVNKMNEKAKELNLKNTLFQNTTGLPEENHYSSAYDMGVMANELLKHESITEYTSIYEDYLRQGKDNEFWLVNTNKLVRFYKGADGLKTGYTSEAKYCLTATAQRDDMRVIAVVMGAESPKERNRMVTELLDYAFHSYETNPLFSKGDKVTEVDLLKADQSTIDIVTDHSVSTLHKKGDKEKDISTEVKLQESWTFPVKKGDEVGKLIIKDGDTIISEVPLTVSKNIEKASFSDLMKRSLQELVKH